MADFQIYGVASNGNRTHIAHTPLARAAKAYRDRDNGSWERILVCGPDGELSIAELDRLALMEDRFAKGF